MKISALSASAYSTYEWCPWKYYLQYTLGFEDESGPAAVLGTLAHKVLEVLSRASVVRHDTKSKIWSPEYLWRISYDHYCNEYPSIMEQIGDDKLRKVSRGVCQLIDSEYTPIRINTISAEAKFDIPVVDPAFILERKPTGEPDYFKLRGRIDRVDQLDSETIEIVDYKTGSRVAWDSKDKHKKEPNDLHKEIQPRMYHVAAKHLYPWAKNVLVTFIYLVDGGPVTVPFCDTDLNDTYNMLRRRFLAIKNNDDPQRNLTWKCSKMCFFGKDDNLCEHLWNEKAELGKEFVENKYVVLNIKKRYK